jgi:hypothetical protein
MKIGVSLKIDVTKIEKARLYKGEKGTYLDCIAFIDIDQKDQYGNNGFIAQSVTKEEKVAGMQGPILGNSRVFFQDSNGQPEPKSNRPEPTRPNDYDEFGDSAIPF